MAAFENKSGPDLDVFIGRSWSEWKNAVESYNVDTKIEANHRQNKEVARLKRRDFRLFGYCPAKDDFYVVVCEHCHRPVKPQAFSFHLEKYHTDKSNRITASSLSSVPPSSTRPSLFSTLSSLSKSPTLSKDFSFDSSTKGVLLEADGKERIHQKLHKPKSIKSNSSKKRLSSHNDLHKTSKSFPKTKQLKLDEEKPSVSLKSSTAVKSNALSQSNFNASHPSSNNSNSYNSSSSKLDKKGTFRLTIAKSSAEESAACESALLSNGPVVVLEKSLSTRLCPQVYKASSSSGASVPSTPRNKQQTHHHNPQVDVVKSPDRGNTLTGLSSSHKQHGDREVEVKTKKFVPVKNRDYDPNKHCGVITEPNNTHCTRSLTCKNHARSLKRKVSDVVGASDGDEESSKQFPATKPPTSNPKVTTQQCNKNKSFLQLFPRPSVCVVDRWQDSMQFEERSKNRNQFFSPRHPAPLTICHFGSRKVTTNFCSFNRRPNYQWRVLSSLNGGQTRKQNFVSLVESHHTSARFTSISPMSPPTVATLRREMTAHQRLSVPTDGVRTNFVPSFGLRRLFSKRSPHFCSASSSDPSAMRNVPTVRYNLTHPGNNPSSNTVCVSVPLDNRLMETIHSKFTQNRTAPSAVFSSDTRLGFAQECNPGAQLVSRDVAHQRVNSQSLSRNVHGTAKALHNQLQIKHELSGTNGVSSEVLSTNQTVLQRPLTEARLQASYIFADESAAIGNVNLDQIKLSREQFAKISQNSNNSNNTKINTEDLSKPQAGMKSRDRDLVDSVKDRRSYQHNTVGTPSTSQHSRQLSTASQNSDNWTSDFLSLLEPKIETAAAATPATEDFTFSLRENFINFSNDSATRTEISNT